LCDRLARRKWAEIRRLGLRHIPIEARVAEPERIGVDRLLGAVAVNRLRNPRRPAISVDMGTAITINLINADGAFEGGAILAGPGVALAALHEATASLPLLAPPDLGAKHAVVGKTTEQAMRSGAFWGAVGAVREITRLMAVSDSQPSELFLTGGGSQHFTPLLASAGCRPRHVPYLVLAGIRLAAEALPAT
jgi:type III pantothenate kinase